MEGTTRGRIHLFGAIFFLSLFFVNGFREVVSGLLLAVAFAIPGVWFFLHERQAKLGNPMRRHWGKVAAAAVGIFLTAGVVFPTQPQNTEVTQFSSPLTSSSRPTTTTSAPKTTTTTEITETAEPITPEEPEVQPEPEAPNEVIPNNFVNVPEPAPAVEPAPVQSASYGSCAQARAAGAAPLYAGSPGYSRQLDRDGDGVACE